MRKLHLTLVAMAALASTAAAGTEYVSGKEMRQTTTVAPEECFYGENEWNVSLWGTYALTGTSSHGVGVDDFVFGHIGGDRYLEADHAWGGGGSVKYFWHKYFGFGVEGFVLDAKRTQFNYEFPTANPKGFIFTQSKDRRAIGSVLGTFTLRYPIGCSRFAPYVWGGGGIIFGGGEKDHVVTAFDVTGAPVAADTHHHDGDGVGLGQFGGGLEVRITRHIGWINDFSWNVVDGPKNNFGMVRTGINFAF